MITAPQATSKITNYLPNSQLDSLALQIPSASGPETRKRRSCDVVSCLMLVDAAISAAGGPCCSC